MASTAALVALLAACTAPHQFAAAARRDWSKFKESDWDRVDIDWEEGDDEEELVTEDELEIRRMEARRAAAPEVSPDDLTRMDTEAYEYIKHSEAATGPTMMFAELTKLNPETGKVWTEDDRNVIAAQWRDLLETGGLEVTVYNIDEDKVLVTLQHGWEGFQLLRFLLEQSTIVVEVEWNQHKYHPGDEVQADFDEFAASKSLPDNVKSKPAKKASRRRGKRHGTAKTKAKAKGSKKGRRSKKSNGDTEL